MGNITWGPTYSVDVKMIDLQHQKLFSILNTLYDEIHGKSNDKATMPIVEDTLLDLKTYVQFHFAEEAKYFKKFQYEKTEEHNAQHSFYEKKINELYERYLGGEANMENEIIDFLDEWILNHINIADKEYTKCFHDHGLY